MVLSEQNIEIILQQRTRFDADYLQLLKPDINHPGMYGYYWQSLFLTDPLFILPILDSKFYFCSG
jgi:hypothetical protein